MAAVVKITTESQTDKTPYEVLEQLEKLKDQMEKKYRLKPEVSKYIVSNSEIHDTIEPLKWWLKNTDVSKEALEEVPERIELSFGENNGLFHSNGTRSLSINEVGLCEKALNGELERPIEIEELIHFLDDQLGYSVLEDDKDSILLIEKFLKERQ